MTAKEKLYYLLRAYLKGEYNTKTFSDVFSYTYYFESNDEAFTDQEKELFDRLAVMTDRFSPYEEDLKNPNAFFNEQQVREKVEEISKILHLTF